MNQALKDVQSWMSFMGWTNGGQPGSIKTDAAGQQCAAHGDNTWVKDVEDACAKCQRAAVVKEIERRELNRLGVPSDMTAADVKALFSLHDDDDSMHMDRRSR